MNQTPIIAAEFTKGGKTRPHTLDITRIANGNRECLETMTVLDKREARAVAKALGATPWNF